MEGRQNSKAYRKWGWCDKPAPLIFLLAANIPNLPLSGEKLHVTS